MSTSTPPTASTSSTGANMPQYLSAGVAAIVSVGLFVLLAIGKTTWAEVGPIIGVLAGVHSGAALATTASSG